MKTTATKKLFALFTAVMLMAAAHAQNVKPLDIQVLDYMKNENITGCAFSLIKDGKIALTKSYGCADYEKDIPYTPNTIQEIASISKTITATALMQLWEQDLFELDDPINNYLPFPITNPNHPGIPITFSMLLDHTSSIFGNEQDLPGNILAVAPGTAMSLHDYLQSRFVPGGSLYNFSTPSFYNFPPGSQFQYSNTGYAVLGYLVELISATPFDEYCDQNIFQPLCMNNTSWYYSGVNMNLVSLPYAHTSQHSYYDFFETLDYPCRQLKTNVIDLSKYLLMHMNYGILDGNRIIDSTTAELMRVPQVIADSTAAFLLEHTHGFFKPYWYAIDKTYLGHDGNGDGVGTVMFANLTDETGILFFQNANNLFPEFFPLYFYLDSLVDTLSTAAAANITCSYLYNPCQHSINYWKNNSAEWPINSVPMKIGTKHYYTANQILAVLNLPVNNDASRVLAKSMIAAKLNMAQGSELAPIYMIHNDAMNIIGTKRIPFDVPVSFSSATGIQMLALAATLDSYNTGNMNVNACSGNSARESADAGGESIFQYQLTNSPNPVSASTTISFSIPQTEKVALNIYDVSGRIIQTLADEEMNEGLHQLVWNVEKVNAGIYFLQLETANYSENLKLIVAK